MKPMEKNKKYWNPIVETLPRERLVEIELKRFREVLQWAKENPPFYRKKLLAEVAREMGIVPKRDLHIKKMICAGEPMPEPTRLRLEEEWGADVYDHIGGTEPGGLGGMCSEKRGMHVIEPHYLFEMVDLETMSKPIPPGMKGVAVITPLCRRCIPLIRFNLKNVMKVMDEPCPCGRTSMRVDQIGGRVDDLRKIRGVFFSPHLVEEVIRARFPEVVEFEILLTQEGVMPVLTLKIEVNPSLSENQYKEIRTRIREELKMKTNLTFEIESVKPGGLPRYTLKSARFKDLTKR